jgi:arylsulfatase A-like enzyme
MNVILLSLDTLRAQSMSCYGHTNLTTPYLDELAASGTLFETCISPHIPTHPAHTSLFTGKDVLGHQIITQGGKQELAADVPMLAEIMAARGYFTGAADNLGRWFSRGFDMYEGYSWDMAYKGARKAEAVNKTAFRVLDAARAQDKPFFTFLHYWDPHTPYLPPEPWERMFYTGDECDPANKSMEAVYGCEPFRWYFQNWMYRPDAESPDDKAKAALWTDRNYVNALYDAEIAYMDHSLQQLWHYLEHHDLIDDTLIVIIGDHGEELDEHELWYDHHGLYETNVWVPLIFHHPYAVPEQQRLSGLVTLLDIAPTILDLCGLEGVAEETGMDGASLRSLIDMGSHAGARDGVYLTENAWMRKRGWRTSRYKLIVETGHTPEVYGRSSDELYDLVTDPGEQDNVIDARPEVAARLRADMEAHLAKRLGETGLPDPTEEQEITLRHIGSMDTAVPTDQVFDAHDASEDD